MEITGLPVCSIFTLRSSRGPVFTPVAPVSPCWTGDTLFTLEILQSYKALWSFVHLSGPGDVWGFTPPILLSDLQNQLFPKSACCPYMFSDSVCCRKSSFSIRLVLEPKCITRLVSPFSWNSICTIFAVVAGIFPTYISWICTVIQFIICISSIVFVWCFRRCHCMMSGSIPRIFHMEICCFTILPLFPECPAHLLSLPMCTASDRKISFFRKPVRSDSR